MQIFVVWVLKVVIMAPVLIELRTNGIIRCDGYYSCGGNTGIIDGSIV